MATSPQNRRFVVRLQAAALGFAFLLNSQAALAQSRQNSQLSVSGRRTDGDGAYRSLLVGLPIASTERGPVGRLELNLYGIASLALEGSTERTGEDMSKAVLERTGESMMTKGGQVSLFLFRYTRPFTMAGFYYGGGLGYHEENVDWRQPSNAAGSTLVDAALIHHNAALSGPTGHARIGYRYVGSEYPLLIGTYIGAKHYQAIVKDSSGGGTNGNPLVPLTDNDKEHLLHRFQTTAEFGIEVGFVI